VLIYKFSGTTAPFICSGRGPIDFRLLRTTSGIQILVRLSDFWYGVRR